jgi:hypothetical protein
MPAVLATNARVQLMVCVGLSDRHVTRITQITIQFRILNKPGFRQNGPVLAGVRLLLRFEPSRHRDQTQFARSDRVFPATKVLPCFRR